MNGGRLSDDEVFFLGVEDLRRQLESAAPDGELAEHALRRIGLRYPDESESLGELFRAGKVLPCRELLSELETQFRADSSE